MLTTRLDASAVHALAIDDDIATAGCPVDTDHAAR